MVHTAYNDAWQAVDSSVAGPAYELPAPFGIPCKPHLFIPRQPGSPQHHILRNSKRSQQSAWSAFQRSEVHTAR